MEFNIRVNEKQRLAYIRKEIIEAFGTKLKFQPNTHAAIVYAEGASASDVVRSVEILLEDLKFRAEFEKRKEPISA